MTHLTEHISQKHPSTQAQRLAMRIPESIMVLLIFGFALLPRLLAPGDFWTPDEAKHWSVRVDAFLPAVQEGEYAATNLVGHPGVTTMWLGSLGVLMHQGLASLGFVAADDPYLYRLFLRVPIAIVTALCIALAYPLLRRLFDRRLALLAVFLWITDPFLVAHSKVLHVDALLTSFTLLSILTALVALRLDRQPSDSDTLAEQGATGTFRLTTTRWGMLAASAFTAGLALLTKSPSLILFPMIGLIMLTGVFAYSHFRMFTFSQILTIALLFLSWLAMTILVWVAIWPAAWVDPLGSAWTVLYEIERNGAEPHGWGNFFMGRPVLDPGPLFYPVALVLRLTPWSMIGLLGAGGFTLYHLSKRTFTRTNPAYELANTDNTPNRVTLQSLLGSPALTLLLIFALVFMGILSLLAKKFDRYILPVFPVVDIVAAMGLLWMADGLKRWWSNQPSSEQSTAQSSEASASSLRRPPGWLTAGFWTLVVGGLLINLAWYHPYELAYYNQMVGGGPVAQRSMYVGWGEGLEKAGEYIRQQYNGCDLGVASWYELVILPYTCSPVLHQGYMTVPGHVHYAVLYINQVQRQIKMDEIAPVIQERGSLVHTVRIHGIEYAYVYQLRQPRQYTITADFGSSLRLTGYDVDTSAIRASGVMTMTLQWHTEQEMAQDYMMFVHVFDDQGNLVGQTDVPPGGLLPTSTWGHNHFIDWMHRVPVAADVEGEKLWVTLGIYDPHDMSRLPLSGPSPPTNAPHDGANALNLPAIPIDE
jgi:4-amino-4-deoxy-L-arabinose transferase-like glycosyltransferase